jgi:amino acid adenylation domain-containing protein
MKSQGFSAEKHELLERFLKVVDVSGTTPANGTPFRTTQIDGKDAFPLSFSQRRLWFLDQLEPGNAFYNFPLAVPFKVAVNSAVLGRAINEIVKRHEALRTVFATLAGEPMQVVLPTLALPVAVIDLRHADREAQDAEVIRLGAEMAQRPFDLARGPLLRTALLQKDTEDYVFLLVMHHIISDGWSLGVFWRELMALYNAFYINNASPLPELPIQYADFAVWQRERLQGEKLTQLVSYWRRQLVGIPALQLPTDRPRPAVLSYRGAFQEIVLPSALTHALRGISQREGVTLFMTLFAAFAVLLQRYTSQDDVVVGTYVASRDRAELEDLIGFFINTLVLRVDLAGDPTFRELLGRVRDTALDAYAHQELPFEKLVEELQPERDLSRNPLFQVSFQLFSAQIDDSSPQAANGVPTIDLNRGMAIFDIAVNIWDGPNGLSGHIEYSTDLFDTGTIANFVGHFGNLLTSIVATPDARLSALQIIGDAERRQLLVEWNETSAATPNLCLQDLFEQQVRGDPGAVAIAADGREITYAELNHRACLLAHRLLERGLGREALIAICVERGINMMIGILAVLKAGMAYVPLDPSYPAERLAWMLDDSDVKVLLCEERTITSLPPHTAARLLVDDEIIHDGLNYPRPAIATAPNDLCYVIYTSGSTGKPKGVMGVHRATVNRLQWMWTQFPFEAGEVVCQKTALSFVDSIWEMFGGLLKGVKTVILSDHTVKDPRKFVAALAAAKVSRLVLVPSQLRALMTTGIDLADELPALKYWTLSGEALPYDLYADFRQAVPGARVLNLYGSSEVAADVLCCDLNATELMTSVVPIGRPIANTKVYVLDYRGNITPIGVPGELHVGGAGLARGYYNRPDLTAEKFVDARSTTLEAERLYKTGDLVRYRPDGQLEFLGRFDQQVKVRGYRIELGEIEATLCEHQRVAEAVASAVQKGEDKKLLAYVVPAPDQDQDLRADPEQELTSRWRTVWDETYVNTVGSPGSFNIVGWNSSYSDEPIPASEMRQWVDQTVERALSFKPRRVLEIGCGTGLILLRVAPFCRHYVGTDFSKVALDQLSRELRTAPDKYGHVRLYERMALELADLEGPFDLVILNSIVQYFPSLEYLTQVVRNAVHLTDPTGALLIGDVRSLPLLRAFHTSVELNQAPGTLPIDMLDARIEKRVSEENELVIDPIVFHEFAPEITQVTVDLKRGPEINELTQFRYDVTLRRQRADKIATPEQWLDWSSSDLSLFGLEKILVAEAPPVVGITGIPNARTSASLKAAELIGTQSCKSVAELRQVLQQAVDAAIDPETLWRLGKRLGYDVSIGLLGSGGDGFYDTIFRRVEAGSPLLFFGFPSNAGRSSGNVNQRVTNPTSGVMAQNLVAELRGYLQRRLPQHLVPASIVLLDSLPRTPNGKIDRRSLPDPDTIASRVTRVYQPPRGHTERLLASIWAEVLNIQRVGVVDNFFELGGHSLLATQLISRIRIEFNSELPVRAIFEAPTVEALAKRIDEIAGQTAHKKQITIGRLGRDTGVSGSEASMQSP